MSGTCDNCGKEGEEVMCGSCTECQKCHDPGEYCSDHADEFVCDMCKTKYDKTTDTVLCGNCGGGESKKEVLDEVIKILKGPIMDSTDNSLMRTLLKIESMKENA